MRGTKRKFDGSTEGRSKMKRSRLSDLVNEDQRESTPSEDSVGGDSTPEPRPQEPSSPLDDDDSASKEEKKLGKLSKYRIRKETKKLLKERGVKYLFPIQYMTFDHIYDDKDVIGQARTGTGKTLSFVLPLLERLVAEGGLRKSRGRPPVVLVMAPTRELANQVHSEVQALFSEDLSSFCIYGGSPYEPQESAIARGLDVLVGTPGRILDHMGRGTLDLGQLKHAVLDEADQMLERGFADSVEEILAASFNEGADSANPQMLLFSATVPFWVREVADRYMSHDKVIVDLIGRQSLKTAVTVEHKAICCPYAERPSTIADVIQVYSGAHGRTMIFTKTKQEANELALSSSLKQDCQVLHGDIPQRQREITLKGFREGRFQVLVATDVAARGLDIPEVDLVIQCEPPKDVESYIHRSGRTGRAGRTGVSMLFYKSQQEHMIPLVERKAGVQFQRIGAPQPVDIIKAGARDSIRSLDGIPECVLPHFHEAAEQLIKEKGATNVVAAALAYISGAKEIVSRSLLSAHQGFTTYHLYGDSEIRHVSYFWKILERSFPPEVKSSVKGLRMSKDSMGVVFDLPTDLSDVVKENWRDGYVKLCTPTSLPELKDRPQDFYDKLKSRQGTGRYNGGGHRFQSHSSFGASNRSQGQRPWQNGFKKQPTNGPRNFTRTR